MLGTEELTQTPANTVPSTCILHLPILPDRLSTTTTRRQKTGRVVVLGNQREVHAPPPLLHKSRHFQGREILGKGEHRGNQGGASPGSHGARWV